MKDINDIFNKVEVERQADNIVLKAKISPQFYDEILNAFFSYTGVIEDTLNGKKKYISDIGAFSYYQLSYGQISRFNGQISEKQDDVESTIIVKEEEREGSKTKSPESLASIYEDAKSNNFIDIYVASTLTKAEKFFNYMDTSLFDGKNNVNNNFKNNEKGFAKKSIKREHKKNEESLVENEIENSDKNLNTEEYSLEKETKHGIKEFFQNIIGKKEN
ncbi:MAG: hypothetical protein RSD14_04815 [Clostridia bacterium]